MVSISSNQIKLLPLVSIFLTNSLVFLYRYRLIAFPFNIDIKSKNNELGKKHILIYTRQVFFIKVIRLHRFLESVLVSGSLKVMKS